MHDNNTENDDSTDNQPEDAFEPTVYQTVRDKSSNAGRQYDFVDTAGEDVGLMRERYSNIARSPTIYAVRDFEIVEEKTEFGAADASIEDLDEFRGEVRDFVRRVLFSDDHLSFVETSLSIPRSHHVQIKEHTDGDVITVRFDVEERRRSRDD